MANFADVSQPTLDFRIGMLTSHRSPVSPYALWEPGVLSSWPRGFWGRWSLRCCSVRQTKLTLISLEQFTEYYYNQFDADRKQLAPLYVSCSVLETLLCLLTTYQRDNSMLTFESASVGGVLGIVDKLSVREKITAKMSTC
jgi:hypothetical protein